MENEISTFNVIHWECDLSHLKKSVPFDVQIGVTGGWLNKIAVLQIRWRVMCNVENTTALHFVAENNYTIPNLDLFFESNMKALLFESIEKVNHELGIRTKETGKVFFEVNFTENMISRYYKEFLQAIKIR